MRTHRFHILLILGFTFLLVLSEFLINHYQMPFRLYNSDVFHQLAVIKEFTHSPISPHDPYFSNGPVDLHAGPYYFILYVISKFIRAPSYSVIMVVGGVNIIFLASSIYYFARSVEFSKAQSSLLTLVSLIGWGPFIIFFAGIYEYTNLLIGGSFPSTVGIALMLIILGASNRYFSEPNPTRGYLLLALLLTPSLILSHLLSGIVMIAFISLLIMSSQITKKPSRKSLWLCIVISAGAISSIFIWPPFGLLDLFASSQTVQSGASDRLTQNYFILSNWLGLIGLPILGLVFLPRLLRDRQYFILSVAAFSMLMTISYLFPVRISLYWRFFPFVFFALSVILIKYINKINLYVATVFLIGLSLYGINNVLVKTKVVLSHDASSPEQFANISKKIYPGSVVFSDPNTAYHLVAFAEVRVVSVPYTHANPGNLKASKKAYDDTVKFMTSKQTADVQNRFFTEHKVKYVLLNDASYPDFIKVRNTNWLDTFKLMVPSQLVAHSHQMRLYAIK